MDGSKISCLSGFCPDEHCNAKLYFNSHDLSIECTHCGKRHERSSMKDVKTVTDPTVACKNIIRNLLLGLTKPKKGSDTVKVQGISNFQCKLLSPFLTCYGMDKATGKAKLLTEMGQAGTFDCSILGSRNFLLEKENIEVNGYGRDRTGSAQYLSDTLEAIKHANNGEECLIPVHADGDGHCLVHAISRALVGRELFWHALRENLKTHLITNLHNYKRIFSSFIDEVEWPDIIAECDPAFIPKEGEALGLRNIHILGLANILRRPIILLDSLAGIQSCADYTGVFLPGLVPLEKCRGKNGQLNPPLCVAWSSQGRNHYIGLVGVKDRPVPVLPSWMLPKAWGMSQELLNTYIQHNEKGQHIVGGSKTLQPGYVLKLMTCMEEKFYETHGVSTSLVADVQQYVIKSTGYVGISHDEVLSLTIDAVTARRLYRCLMCDAVVHWHTPQEWLQPNGKLYELALDTHKSLSESKKYSFPTEGIICGYDKQKDELYLDEQKTNLHTCPWCNGNQMRKVRGDGSTIYQNQDRTTTPSSSSALCKCGYKHYWEGKEYDNLPVIYPMTLEWSGQVVQEKVVWFQYESDPSLNSNVYEVAEELVQKHFPGEFGSERLVQNVVAKILKFTETKEDETSKPPPVPGDDPLYWQPDTATKVILSGHHSKGIHKEDLNRNETEKATKRRVEANAGVQQRRKTDELNRQAGMAAGKGKATPGSPLKVSAKQLKTEPSSTVSANSAAQASAQTAQQGAQAGAQAGAQEMPPEKKVRVSASDGRQLVLTLAAVVNISELRERLEKELNVSRKRFRIRHGFPPRLLDAPDTDTNALPIQNGDRINVEILPDPNEVHAVPIRAPDNMWPAQPDTRHAWSSFDPNSHEASAQSMLRGLEQLRDSHDSIDAALASVALTATLQGRDTWSMVQSMPHLFSVGGLFYEQAKKDIGLLDGKHYEIPLLPGRRFRYSQFEDRLELCLEPRGHHQVSPGIEARVNNAPLLPSAPNDVHNTPSSSVAQAMSSGSSGVLVNRPMNYTSNNAFSGHGHSLGSTSNTEARMPGELPMRGTSHAGNCGGSGRVRKLSDSGSVHSIDVPIQEDSAAEEEEEEEDVVDHMDTEHAGSGAANTAPHVRRIAPGYSVVEQSETAAGIQRLASQIESIAEEDDTDDEGEESDIDVTTITTAMDTTASKYQAPPMSVTSHVKFSPDAPPPRSVFSQPSLPPTKTVTSSKPQTSRGDIPDKSKDSTSIIPASSSAASASASAAAAAASASAAHTVIVGEGQKEPQQPQDPPPNSSDESFASISNNSKTEETTEEKMDDDLSV